MRFEVIVYQDIENLMLEQTFDFLNLRKEKLILEKENLLDIIDDFNRKYEIELGEILNNILNLKKKLSYKQIKKYSINIEVLQNDEKVKKKKYEKKKNIHKKLKKKLQELSKNDKEYFEVLQNLKNIEIEIEKLKKEHIQINKELKKEETALKQEEIDFEELVKEYENIKEIEEQEEELNKKELRNIYKKATKLCHPDIIKDKEDIFKVLNEYYQNDDLANVKQIFEDLTKEKIIKSKKYQQNRKELLKDEIKNLEKIIKNLELEIYTIKTDEVFEIKNEYLNLDDFFIVLKEDLTKEYEELKQQLLLKRGEQYEYFIGEFYEENDYLVIYNGLIKSFKDKGVDIIAINENHISIIQCKNWNDKILYLNNIENIYSKLSNYKLDIFNIDIKTIQKYLQIDKSTKSIKKQLKNLFNQKKFIIEKYLYISNENSISLEAGKYLKMIEKKQFLYKDMKIFIKKIF